MRAGVWAVVLWSVAAAATAAEYDLQIRGLTVGRLALEAAETDGRYRAIGRIDSTGLARLFRRFSYRGDVSGRVSGGRFRPERYVEVADTGRRSSEAELVYRDGVPRVLRYTSPIPAAADAPDPATQAGTVDPLTAIHAMLRDVAPAEACQLDVALFDGRRRSRIAMRPAGASGGLPVCRGVYQRLEGFTPDEVARHRSFDFTLTYRRGAGAVLEVARVAFQSLYGTASIERR